MNKYIKRILCGAFSDDSADKKVTVGSILSNLMIYIFISLIIITILLSVIISVREIHDCVNGIPCFDEQDLTIRMILEVLGTTVIMVSLGLIGIYIINKIFSIILDILFYIIEYIPKKFEKILSIEITRCERKN